MTASKTPVINFNAALNRVVLMIVTIVLGMLISLSTAQAGVKVEKNPFNKSVGKKKNHSYSCNTLMEKHRNSTNIVVKVSSKRPKWR